MRGPGCNMEGVRFYAYNGNQVTDGSVTVPVPSPSRQGRISAMSELSCREGRGHLPRNRTTVVHRIWIALFNVNGSYAVDNTVHAGGPLGGPSR
jgi:hypothetical protein